MISRIKLFLIVSCVLLICSSCQDTNLVTISAASTNKDATEQVFTPTPRPKLPQWFIDSLPKNVQSLTPYMDLRGNDLEDYQKPIDRSLIETFWYDGATNWPPSVTLLANQVLEEGKNPGLGIRSLHAQGITGKGVSVAIIDLPLSQNHPEYKGKIVSLKYFDPNDVNPQSDLHGPAVASLLVGTNTGTAPDAKLYYAAAPLANSDAQFLADGLNWIIDTNESLPKGERIRVVSVSTGPSGPGSPYTQNNGAWDAAYDRATRAGILVLDCTKMHNKVDVCTIDLSDPENPEKCIPGWPGKYFVPDPTKIYVPFAHRTFAESFQEGIYSYQFDGQGGLSWAIPYLAGVLALGWQVNPDLTKDQIVELLFESAYVNPTGAKILNPVAFIEKVKETLK